MYDPRIKVSRLNEKINFVALRLAAFARWEAPKHLAINKRDCMVALNNQMDFLEVFKTKTSHTLQLNTQEENV